MPVIIVERRLFHAKEESEQAARAQNKWTPEPENGDPYKEGRCEARYVGPRIHKEISYKLWEPQYYEPDARKPEQIEAHVRKKPNDESCL